ncbi:hypothetical protein [Hyphobacterium sp.]|uniref:hypothetical protein n=1 Tax=Hyphobacterium sp. TaxID=2004662 RepID=UPI003BACFEA2
MQSLDYRPVEAGAALEARVEGDAISDLFSRLKFSAQAGLQFLRTLKFHGAGRLCSQVVRKFPFQGPPNDQRHRLSPDSLSWLELHSGRVPDGNELEAVLTSALKSNDLKEIVSKPGNLAQALKDAAEEWLLWMKQMRPSVEESAWVPDRLEYRFSIAGHLDGKTLSLEANEYHGGRIDWWLFDRSETPADLEGSSTTLTKRALPAPIEFTGMPSPRWWEIEDSEVDLGSVYPDQTDLAQLLVIEFALVFGNDYFILPIDVPAGHLCRMESIIVTDSFGEKFKIGPSGKASDQAIACRMFEIDGDEADTGNLIVIPDVLAGAPVIRKIEAALLVRDEDANLVWGIEQKIPGLGVALIDRHEAWLARLENLPASESNDQIAPLKYSLTTDVADFWIPFQRINNDLLRRTQLGDPNSDASRPWGQLLAAHLDPFNIRTAEVPAEGLEMTRRVRFAYGRDGVPYVWAALSKSAGIGPASSGLSFDHVDLSAANQSKSE